MTEPHLHHLGSQEVEPVAYPILSLHSIVYDYCSLVFVVVLMIIEFCYN